jgi:hypothetical protein
MKFEPVSPDDVPNMRESHRGRVSYPILKSFLETGYIMAKLDRTGMQQSMMSLNSSLGAYIRSHGLPIKLFQRKGEIYLMRLDLNPDGTENPNWKEDLDEFKVQNATPIDADEVARRFAEEKGQVTK